MEVKSLGDVHLQINEWLDRYNSAHVDVAGLQPARVYHYRFIAGGHASATGRTRTAPAAFAPVTLVRMFGMPRFSSKSAETS